jgi:hypothetical protein
MVRALVVILFLAAAGARPKADPTALETARKWLSTVAAGDSSAVAKVTSVPFTFATTAKVKRCEGVAADQERLGKWLDCLRRDNKLLLEEARQGALTIADPPNVESKVLRALGSKIATKGTWIEAIINGDGVTYTFRFLIVGNSIAAFLVDAEVERG